MAKYQRQVLFGKFNAVAFKAMEGAVLACKMRGHGHVTLAHWVYQVGELPDSDLRLIVREFGIDPARLAADLTRALDELPVGAEKPRVGTELSLAFETAFFHGSIRFQEARVRTGHILYAMLITPELARSLRALSSQFGRIDPERLAGEFEQILADSPESKLAAEAARSDVGQVPAGPAEMGGQRALQRYTTDLTERARAGQIDAVVGRDEEIRQCIDVLMRRRQNNPLLTGEAGVGKTAVAEGLALRIAQGDVPPAMQEVRLLALDVALLQAGASMKGEFEQRLRQVIEEVQASEKPVILFIDEAHTLIGAGGAKGTGDAANLLKPALARGTLRTIAATTWSEYKEFIDPDPALTRRFQVVQVEEPDDVQALQILRGVVKALEKHHAVQVLEEALHAAVQLSRRYVPARQLPDKAISLLDTACARVAVSHHGVPAAIQDERRRIESLEAELDILARERAVGIEHAARESAALEQLCTAREALCELEARWQRERDLVMQALTLREQLHEGAKETRRAEDASDSGRAMAQPRPAEDDPSGEGPAPSLAELEAVEDELRELQGEVPLVTPVVDAQCVGGVVSDWTGVPVGRMVRDEAQAVLNLGETLSRRVIGQDHAIETIASGLVTSRAGLENPNRPIGVFLLAGPSGVGKTETALALAEALYGGEHNVITINMSEYKEQHNVSLLKGAPPGYVGYGKGGVLTEAVRRRPYSVVLLDEVEKAHRDVHEVFFQVFDKGVMEDGTGRVIDFKNTLILLTSNVGTHELMAACAEGAQRVDPGDLIDLLERPLQDVFPPALLGRMTVIPYYPLSSDMIDRIARLQLRRIGDRLVQRHGVELHYGDDVVGFIRQRCTDVHSGARAIERVLTTQLLPGISRELLTRLLDERDVGAVTVRVSGGAFQCEFTA